MNNFLKTTYVVDDIFKDLVINLTSVLTQQVTANKNTYIIFPKYIVTIIYLGPFSVTDRETRK